MYPCINCEWLTCHCVKATNRQSANDLKSPVNESVFTVCPDVHLWFNVKCIYVCLPSTLSEKGKLLLVDKGLTNSIYAERKIVPDKKEKEKKKCWKPADITHICHHTYQSYDAGTNFEPRQF